VPGEARAKIESALSDLRTALKGDDKEQIDRRTDAVQQAVAGLAAQAGPAGSEGGGATSGGAGGGGAEQAAGKDDVVDAEFEEVKDKNPKGS
jgi:molecular chaperone DnaK